MDPVYKGLTFGLFPYPTWDVLSEKGFLASSSEEDPLIQGGTVRETSHSLFRVILP